MEKHIWSRSLYSCITENAEIHSDHIGPRKPHKWQQIKPDETTSGNDIEKRSHESKTVDWKLLMKHTSLQSTGIKSDTPTRHLFTALVESEWKSRCAISCGWDKMPSLGLLVRLRKFQRYSLAVPSGNHRHFQLRVNSTQCRATTKLPDVLSSTNSVALHQTKISCALITFAYVSRNK